MMAQNTEAIIETPLASPLSPFIKKIIHRIERIPPRAFKETIPT